MYCCQGNRRYEDCFSLVGVASGALDCVTSIGLQCKCGKRTLAKVVVVYGWFFPRPQDPGLLVARLPSGSGAIAIAVSTCGCTARHRHCCIIIARLPRWGSAAAVDTHGVRIALHSRSGAALFGCRPHFQCHQLARRTGFSCVLHGAEGEVCAVIISISSYR